MVVGIVEHYTCCSSQYCTPYQLHSPSASETKSMVLNEQWEPVSRMHPKTPSHCRGKPTAIHIPKSLSLSIIYIVTKENKGLGNKHTFSLDHSY